MMRYSAHVLTVAALALASCGDSGSTATAASSPPTTAPTSASNDAATPTHPPSTPAPTATPDGTASTVTSTAPAPDPLIGLTTSVVAEVGFPVDFATAGERLFIADKRGFVHLWENGDLSVFTDISGRVADGREQGLLGLALAPDFDVSGLFYLNYTNRSGDTVVEEFSAGATDSPVRTVITVRQPASNHNGGSIVFGPGGELYVGMGDGGGANDRFGTGQDPRSLLGSILRLDVAGEIRPAENNPYDGENGAREVWAIGVRNPWRMTVDAGALIVADVGQDAFEEITVVPLSLEAPNLGWPRFEGLHCFAGDCGEEGLLMPAVEVEHGDGGTCSITGGVVYHGSAIPEWEGSYFYSDLCGGYLRSVDLAGGEARDHADWTAQLDGPIGAIVAMGTDPDGELLLAVADGRVLRVDPVR